MNGTRSVFEQGLDVRGRAVALVLREAVLGIDPIEFEHAIVPHDFGDDAGRRD